MRWFALLVAGLALLAGFAATVSGGATQAQARWVVTDLGVGTAEAINDQGQVVGERGWRAFLWERGRMRSLGTFRGLDYSVAYDINNRGQIVGSSFTVDDNDRDANQHALLWEKGRMHPLAVPKRHGGEALAINDTGEIVGWADELDQGGVGEPVGKQAVLWQKGIMRNLGTVGGGFDSMAEGVNNRTQVVGESGRTDSNEYMFDLTGFVWQNGVMRSLGRLSDQDDGVGAINDKGQIVGSRGGHATVWEGGTPRDLATTRAESSSASDINNRGQIVGDWARSNNRSSRGALWENGKLTLLPNLPRGDEAHATAINVHGQIVGYAGAKNGYLHAVLWTLKP